MTRQTLEESRLKKTIDQMVKNAIERGGTKGFIELARRMATFNAYSVFNHVLVHMQNPDVKYFGTASYWEKKHKRRVDFLSQKYIILVPGGPVDVVYDVMNTFGEQPPLKWIDEHEHQLKARPSIHSEKHWEGIKSRLNTSNIWLNQLSGFDMDYIKLMKTPVFEGQHMLRPHEYGKVILHHSANATIQLRYDLGEADLVLTAIHELAHLFLGHLGQFEFKTSRDLPPEKVIRSRKLSVPAMELEAEIISFMLGEKLGYTSASENYLAFYLKDTSAVEEVSLNEILNSMRMIEEHFLQ